MSRHVDRRELRCMRETGSEDLSRGSLPHLKKRYGKVSFRLTEGNAVKLQKIAESLPCFKLPPLTRDHGSKRSALVYALNKFFDRDPPEVFQIIRARRRKTRICVHLDLRLRYALWRANRTLKITQNELVNLAIESYPLDPSVKMAEK